MKRRRVSENSSKRHCSVEYYIKIKDTVHRICQKTLCDIYQITPRRVQILVEKIKFNKPLNDARGNHENRPNRIPHEDKDLVRGHIASFPLQDNHYSRNESTKQCLSPDLSVEKMWVLFKEKYPNTKVTLHCYRDVFNTKFHLRFGAPRSDTCELCDSLFLKMISNDDPAKLRNLEIESRLHHARADSAYKSLDNDGKTGEVDKDTVCLCVDLEQVLYCPTLTHGNVFYQRQLSCYNLCVHDKGKNKSMMFLWDETKGKRGSAEIASCILAYVTHYFEPLANNNKKRHLIIWSDRCTGQNNNWKMIALLQHLVMNNYFTTVDQKFLTTGHSFLPCDRDFALIERRKKCSMVYVPSQWVEVITSASNKFSVYMMSNDDFKDMSIVERSLRTGNFRITHYVWLRITHDDPCTVQARPSHNIMQSWTSHCLAKKVRGRRNVNRPPVRVSRFPSLYKGPLSIKPEKKADLMAMMPYVPEEFRGFYIDIKTTE